MQLFGRRARDPACGPLLSNGAADTKALSGAHAGLSATTVEKLEDISVRPFTNYLGALMGWGRRYPQEQQAAQHALIATTAAVSSALSNFVGWLLAVSGASFALMVSNIEKITPHIGGRSFKWALIWFAISLLLGLISRWLGTSVTGAVAAVVAMRDRIDRTGPIDGFSHLAFTKLFSDGLMPIYRCISWRSYKRSKTGDLIPGLRGITYQSQAQALLTLGQLVLLFVSVVVLAHGVEA